MLTQIINAKILTPQGWLKDGSVLMRDNKILEVTNCDLAVIGAELIDAKGMYVVPGGVEIHCHGGGGGDFMEGTELTCGCYKTKEKSVVFPPTEVVTHNEFFDYDAKYNGQVDEITPARISDELTDRVQMLTSAIYDILGCSGIIRVDYIVTAGEKINLLEVNTTPGMTATSFIPQQVRAAGLEIKDVMTDIIENKF
jgi:hypothetical protein